jgi:hypothetical protein
MAAAVRLDVGEEFAFPIANCTAIFDVRWPAALPPFPLEPSDTQPEDRRGLPLTKERVVHGTVAARINVTGIGAARL